MEHLPSGALMAHAIRLNPGQDLVPAMKKAAETAMKNSKTQSAFILSVVGSVDKLTLRMANASKNEGDKSTTTNEIKEWDERFEVVSLVGTFCMGGKHLHMSASDGSGNVIGGHLIGENTFEVS